MKKRITLLIAAALLAVVGVQAAVEKTQVSFRVHDAYWVKVRNVSGETIKTGADAAEHTYYSSALVYSQGYNGIDVDDNTINFSDYDYIEFNLSSNVASLTSCYFEQEETMFTTQHDLGVIPANTTTIRYAIPSGVTIKSISLRNYNDDDNLKYSGDSDGELNGKTPFTISSINLVKREEISGDYYELSLANAKAFSGSPTLSGETITFPAGGNQFGWDMSEYDLSNFQYLVVVPKAQFESGQNQIQYAISDVSNTNTFWGFAYGTYQRHRIAVLDIQNTILPKSNNDLTSAWAENAYTALDRTKYTKIYFQAENPRDFEVSAVFLTNTLPTFQNEWYGADQCNGLGDHVRTAATAGTYGTVCLPYDAAICGADAYTVVGVDKLDNPSALYLEKVTGILKKGVSYIYETKSSTENCGNAAFYKVGSATTATPTGTNLIGTFSDNTEVPNGSYILKDGVWKKSNGSAKVNANRAYLTLTSDLVVPAAAPGMIIMDISGSEVTGIETVHGEGLVVNDSDIYDLSGRKVSQPTKGIYVKNGKKYVVK